MRPKSVLRTEERDHFSSYLTKGQVVYTPRFLLASAFEKSFQHEEPFELAQADAARGRSPL